MIGETQTYGFKDNQISTKYDSELNALRACGYSNGSTARLEK